MSGAALTAASPCIGICRLHATRRVCIGCGRTGEEIAGWGTADDAQRHAVLARLPARLSTLDVRPTAVAMGRSRVRGVIREALARSGTAVVVGCHGAVAEFMAPPDATPCVVERGEGIEAAVAGGAMRLRVPDDLALFGTVGGGMGGDGLASDQTGSDAAPAPFVLAASAPGRTLRVAKGLTRLGADPAPIRAGKANDRSRSAHQPAPSPQRCVCASEGCAGAILFDLGLGHASVRFMVRTADPVLIARLDGLTGASLGRVIAEAGPILVEASPNRVVETSLSRIEVTTPIPPPGSVSPAAPHTHLLPGALALGRVLPPGVSCPEDLVPVALLYLREGAP